MELNAERDIVSKEEETRRARSVKNWTRKLGEWLGPHTLTPEQKSDRRGDSLITLCFFSSFVYLHVD